LYYDPRQRFLAQQWVEQRPYPALMAGRGFHQGLRWAGRALAQLHGLPADSGPAKTTDRHLAELMTPPPADLAARLPALAPRLRAVIGDVGRLCDGSPAPLAWPSPQGQGLQATPSPVAPIHRDFHLRQLFFGGRRVWLIDWDQYALGDPALDVGNFLVYLETHLDGRIGEAQEAFLEGYGVAAGDALWARLPGYRALTYLRLACKAYRLQQPGWERRLERMLARAEVLLAGASR
jgi:aminoglycoside phosphotransferase (APT) family kinase protein